MTLHKGLYDRLIYEDEVGELASLSGQHRALVAVPTAHQRREQFIAELVHRLPELLDAAAAGQPNASEKAKGYWGQRDIGVKSCKIAFTVYLFCKQQQNALIQDLTL
jgi:hypothetical protein